MPIRPVLRTVAVFAALSLAAPLTAQVPPSGAAQAREVGVVTLERAQVPYQVTLPGRSVAFDEVAVRPRVSGMISEIAYEPGRNVAAGDLLFRIEGDTYAADVAAAEADLEGARAALQSAEATLGRYQRLSGTGVAATEVETAEVSVAQARATVSAAEAALDLARLELDRTTITSPIDGIVALPEVSVGDLVTANQTDALTTVTRIDPIYVDVQESIRRIQEVRARFEAGTLMPGEVRDVTLELETGTRYDGQGSFVSPPINVSTTTGTSAIRFSFPNPDRRILPGQFLRVHISVGTAQAILVPQGATSRAGDGSLTAFVVTEGVAEERMLTEEGTFGNDWVVTEGVTEGETLVVDGLRNLMAGAEVRPVPVAISEEGVAVRADGQSESFISPAAASGDSPPVTSGETSGDASGAGDDAASGDASGDEG
ncbi:efflux RND transporter periplasmic adaptor subunit [Salipiger manganoxidans]|uniref:efflux RND transporter periplasmic adaptor subunit n=1 Tax=Salipiger marinus TaxID=555512 RepID=UPI001E28E892|nr:efflux RND transporter periplasmic adaptor subunit [Salipiger manganoxidans]MCD1619955.1 efflux RND transporter periplasmic adaptor subunit [Salipiger manganoxidans]